MVRRHIIFHGRVQGVGFRYYCVHKARQLNLTGWVRNRYDGTVEAEVQGREEDIRALTLFLAQCRYVCIEWMDTENLPVTEERDFLERE